MALQRHFKTKRDHVLKRLHALHLDVDVPPQATFYVWLNLEKLPPPLNNGLVSRCFCEEGKEQCVDSLCQTFFEELLKEQTIVIPGIFFDINPAHRRNLFNSPCHHYVRLSFGPPIEDLDKGKFRCYVLLALRRSRGRLVSFLSATVTLCTFHRIVR